MKKYRFVLLSTLMSFNLLTLNSFASDKEPIDKVHIIKQLSLENNLVLNWEYDKYRDRRMYPGIGGGVNSETDINYTNQTLSIVNPDDNILTTIVIVKKKTTFQPGMFVRDSSPKITVDETKVTLNPTNIFTAKLKDRTWTSGVWGTSRETTNTTIDITVIYKDGNTILLTTSFGDFKPVDDVDPYVKKFRTIPFNELHDFYIGLLRQRTDRLGWNTDEILQIFGERDELGEHYSLLGNKLLENPSLYNQSRGNLYYYLSDDDIVKDISELYVSGEKKKEQAISFLAGFVAAIEPSSVYGDGGNKHYFEIIEDDFNDSKILMIALKLALLELYSKESSGFEYMIDKLSNFSSNSDNKKIVLSSLSDLLPQMLISKSNEKALESLYLDNAAEEVQRRINTLWDQLIYSEQSDENKQDEIFQTLISKGYKEAPSATSRILDGLKSLF